MAGAGASGADKRLLIVGWDGADWDILNDLSARGCLPHISSLIESGARGVLQSVIPSHSWAAWPTFLTGEDPPGHGVFDFVERDPARPGMRLPVTSASIKAPTFLEYLSEAGREVRVGNVPVAYPPIPVNGKMISGVAVPPGGEFVHPLDWAPELERRAPFPVNGLEWMNYEHDPESLLEEARQLIEQRTASFEVLLEGNWDTAACIYVEPDRLQHAFGAYLLPSHPDHEKLAASKLGESLRDVYRLLDACTERLSRAAGPETAVILMSDHGFRPITRQLDLNRLLKHLGFASGARSATATTALRQSSVAKLLKRTKVAAPLRRKVKMPSTLDWSRTRAYKATTGGGLSLNLKGREPHGIVEPQDYERVRSELSAALLEYVDPESGERPIAETFARESLYEGPFLHLAPDLFVKASELWGMSASSQGNGLSSYTRWPTGRHRRAGIIVANGPHVVPGDLGVRHLRDIAPTALAFHGLRAPSSAGSPIQEISGSSGHEVTVSPIRDSRRQSELTNEEQQQITDHLRDLGYIE
ncbi:MAG: alkaline phosphatase family protein [Actinomycetota bacterium]